MRVTTSCVFYDIEKQNVWIVHSRVNALFLLSLKDYSTRFIAFFDDRDRKAGWEIKKILKINNSLLFFSSNSNEVWIMDETSFVMERKRYGTNDHLTIKDVIVEDNCVTVIPTRFENPIININLDSWIYKEIEWNNTQWDTIDEASFTETFEYDNKVFFFSRKIENICLFSIEKESFDIQMIKLNEIENIGCAPLIIGGDLWALGRKLDGNVALCKYGLDGELYLSIDIAELCIDQSCRTIVFSHMIYWEHKIIILPALTNKIVIANTLSSEIFYIDLKKELSRAYSDITDMMIFGFFQRENTLFLFSEKYPVVVMLDTGNFECDYRIIEDEEFVLHPQRVAEMNNSNYSMLIEDGGYDLEAYLKGIGKQND